MATSLFGKSSRWFLVIAAVLSVHVEAAWVPGSPVYVTNPPEAQAYVDWYEEGTDNYVDFLPGRDDLQSGDYEVTINGEAVPGAPIPEGLQDVLTNGTGNPDDSGVLLVARVVAFGSSEDKASFVEFVKPFAPQLENIGPWWNAWFPPSGRDYGNPDFFQFAADGGGISDIESAGTISNGYAGSVVPMLGGLVGFIVGGWLAFKCVSMIMGWGKHIGAACLVLLCTSALRAGVPGQATGPSPANGAVQVLRNSVLSWSAGTDATLHTVKFGISNPPITVGVISSTTFDAGTMSPGTLYYWRIDESNDDGTTIGVVWSFTTLPLPGIANSPSPGSGVSGTHIDSKLNWTGGSFASSHDVYFGATNPPPFIKNQGGVQYDPGTGVLQPDVTYYWRIDELNASGISTGNVWLFHTLLLPAPAGSPTPSDGSITIPVNQHLAWSTASLADSYELHIGVGSVPDQSTSVQGNMFDPGILQSNATYKWRVDSLNTSGTTQGPVWTFSTVVLPGQAVVVSPANGSTGIAITASLGWTAGSNTNSHDVYFGTANPPASKGNQQSTAYTPPASMLAGALYYWRIDEKNQYGTTVGVLWTFTTLPLPGVATSPFPANSATGVSVTPTLTWVAGSNAVSHDVRFGTVGSLSLVGNQSGTNYTPATLTGNTQYIWRIDEKNSSGTVTGPQWTFRTGILPGAPTSPVPASAATNVALLTTISWTAGSNTTSHDVYFSATTPPMFLTNQQGTTYTPLSPLFCGGTYFWKIGERNAVGVMMGPVWSFSTIPKPAAPTSPNPATASTGKCTNITLSWTVGSGTVSNDVYIGTDPLPSFVVNQSGSSYTPSGLLPSTTYYWQIGEHGSNGCITLGPVWSLATLPLPAQVTGPQPSDFTTNVNVGGFSIAWSAAANATSYDVWLGTEVLVLQTNTTALSYFVQYPKPHTIYKWRIDSKNACYVTTGTQWTVTTGGGITCGLCQTVPISLIVTIKKIGQDGQRCGVNLVPSGLYLMAGEHRVDFQECRSLNGNFHTIYHLQYSPSQIIEVNRYAQDTVLAHPWWQVVIINNCLTAYFSIYGDQFQPNSMVCPFVCTNDWRLYVGTTGGFASSTGQDIDVMVRADGVNPCPGWELGEPDPLGFVDVLAAGGSTQSVPPEWAQSHEILGGVEPVQDPNLPTMEFPTEGVAESGGACECPAGCYCFDLSDDKFAVPCQSICTNGTTQSMIDKTPLIATVVGATRAIVWAGVGLVTTWYLVKHVLKVVHDAGR